MKNILVIGNHDSSARICEVNLESLGCKVMWWYRGVRKPAKNFREFDAIIIAEQNNGPLSAIALAKHIRQKKRCRHIPIFLLISQAGSEEDQEAQRLKAEGMIAFAFLTPFAHAPATMRMIIDRAHRYGECAFMCAKPGCRGCGKDVGSGASPSERKIRCTRCRVEWYIAYCWKDGIGLDSRKNLRCLEPACNRMHCPTCMACKRWQRTPAGRPMRGCPCLNGSCLDVDNKIQAANEGPS